MGTAAVSDVRSTGYFRDQNHVKTSRCSQQKMSQEEEKFHWKFFFNTDGNNIYKVKGKFVHDVLEL